MEEIEIREAVRRFRSEHPNVGSGGAMMWAQREYPGEDGEQTVLAFVRQWWRVEESNAKLDADCARCWPEEKGY